MIGPYLARQRQVECCLTLAACRTRDSRLTHLIDIIALKISFRKDPVLKTKDLRRKSDRLLGAVSLFRFRAE